MAYNERPEWGDILSGLDSPPSTDGSERRTEARTPAAQGSVAQLFPADGNELSLDVENLSPNGAGLLLLLGGDCPSLLSPYTHLTATIRLPDREFTRIVQVRWARQTGHGWQLGVSFVDHTDIFSDSHKLSLRDVRVDPLCAMKIPAHLAARRKLLPLVEIGDVVHVACADSDAVSHLPALEKMLKKTLRFWDVDEAELDEMINRVYGSAAEQAVRLAPGASSRISAGEGQTATLCEELLNSAYLSQASDIHIDPQQNAVVVRFRVDGQLVQHQQLPLGAYQELIGRMKVMGGLDIAEKRAPQDGRFSHPIAGNGRRIDVRVATLPTKHGERMTLRLLALNTESLTLSRLGLSPAHHETIAAFLRRTQGMMVLTGPTGSGKTTTLYAAIRMLLSERNLNVMTVEDPIEYEIGGVAQCEVDSAEKVSFSKALRSILRHDPDVVMIGEIRDQETASIAMKAALTGHLVLGTLHTNSSAATVTRLIDMGIEPYLVAATLRLVVAQRLIRRLCPYCRVPRFLTVREALALRRPELAGHTVYEATGCIYCLGKGYAGRVGLYELLSMTSEWSRAIADNEGEQGLIVRMSEDGVPFLLDDAISKMLAGTTPYGEAMQIASSW
jgi:type IV pilus assembly protein PilB